MKRYLNELGENKRRCSQVAAAAGGVRGRDCRGAGETAHPRSAGGAICVACLGLEAFGGISRSGVRRRRTLRNASTARVADEAIQVSPDGTRRRSRIAVGLFRGGRTLTDAVLLLAFAGCGACAAGHPGRSTLRKRPRGIGFKEKRTLMRAPVQATARAHKSPAQVAGKRGPIVGRKIDLPE